MGRRQVKNPTFAENAKMGHPGGSRRRKAGPSASTTLLSACVRRKVVVSFPVMRLGSRENPRPKTFVPG